jgi:hypothetical protein
MKIQTASETYPAFKNVRQWIMQALGSYVISNRQTEFDEEDQSKRRLISAYVNHGVGQTCHR